jgi:hypothetical protein
MRHEALDLQGVLVAHVISIGLDKEYGNRKPESEAGEEDHRRGRGGETLELEADQ